MGYVIPYDLKVEKVPLYGRSVGTRCNLKSIEPPYLANLLSMVFIHEVYRKLAVREVTKEEGKFLMTLFQLLDLKAMNGTTLSASKNRFALLNSDTIS